MTDWQPYPEPTDHPGRENARLRPVSLRDCGAADRIKLKPSLLLTDNPMFHRRKA